MITEYQVFKSIIDFLIYLKVEYNYSIYEQEIEQILEILSNPISEEDFMLYIQSILCKSKEEYLQFEALYDNYYYTENIENYKQRQKLQEDKNKLEDMLQTSYDIEDIQDVVKKASITRLLNNPLKSTLREKTLEFLENFQSVREKIYLDRGYTKNLVEEINEDLYDSLLKDDGDKFKYLFKIREYITRLIQYHKEKSQRHTEERKELKVKVENIDKKIKTLEKQSTVGQIIIKDGVVTHRDIFRSNGNAVICNSVGENILEKDFKQLTEKEVNVLYNYIQHNSRKFQTKLLREIKAEKNVSIDLKKTVKKALHTGGIPLKLCYKRKRENKPNIICILDVSGSCSSATVMLLSFMYTIKKIFTGGCYFYVFVNELIDINSYFQDSTLDEAVENIKKNVITRGVYSNYQKPLQQAEQMLLGKINNSSLLFFLGDARNNANATGEESLKTLTTRAKGSFWFNTELKSKWGVGDSVMPIYLQYMKDAYEVVNMKQLVEALNQIVKYIA